MRKILSSILIVSLITPIISHGASFTIRSGRTLKVNSGRSLKINNAAPAGIIDKAEGGVITLGSGVQSATYTLASSYDTTRSSLFYEGVDTSVTGSGASTTQASLYFTNGTTITATRGTGVTTEILKVGFHVAQWSSGVTRSVQRGEVFTQANITSNTGTITAVTKANSFVNMLGSNSTTTGSYNNTTFDQSLTNGTTVTATRATVTAGATSTWQVTEFNSPYINSSQECTIAYASSDTTKTCTLSPAVDTTSSIIFYAGNTTGGAFNTFYSQYVLTNGTTITATRTAAGVGNTSILSVVDFNPIYLKSIVQNAQIVINSALTGTATISAVVASSTLLSYNSFQTNQSNVNRALNYIQLSNATTITATKGSNGSGFSTTTMQVLESK